MSEALHASYHEAITQVDRDFIGSELPIEAPAPDSCQLSFQLLSGSQLLIQIPHSSHYSFQSALALLRSDLYN